MHRNLVHPIAQRRE
jgi:uncharacterized membrane protein